MARYFLWALNIINALVFLLLLSIFFEIFNFLEVLTTLDGEIVLSSVLNGLKNIFVYLIYMVALTAGVISSIASTTIFNAYPLFESGYASVFLQFFFLNFLGLWFSFPGGRAPSLTEVPSLIGQELVIFSTDFYLLMFQILFLISILFFIRAIFQNDPKINLVVVGCLVLMIVIPLMVFGFRDMLALFNVTIPYLEEVKNPVDPSLTKLPVDDFFGFFASPVSLMAIISYIYLEISFQINYIDIVTKPSLERGSRLRAQLKILKRESQKITVNVDQIKEEAKKQLEEMELGEKEQVKSFFGVAAERFSYIKEMIKRKKLEDEEKKLVDAASKTRRLGRYVERLFREDPEAESTLTAKSSAPKPKSLATSTLTTFTFRVGILIIISYIIIHPKWFLLNVFQLPPAITESVAMYSPEVVIILLGPIMLLFPVISWVISYTKHRNLIIKLKQEGRIKDILASVGDYVMKEEEEKPGEEGESTSETASSTA